MLLREVGQIDRYENSGRTGQWFRGTVGLIVVVNLSAIVLSTFPELAKLDRLFDLISYISSVVFTVEYAYRIINAIRIHAAWRYIFSFMGMVDFICILPFVLPTMLSFSAEASKMMVFPHVFLIFKVLRYSKAFEAMRDILRLVRPQLQLVLAVSFTFVTFSSILMYYVERGAQPEVFSSVGEGFWWAVITMTTVGYGDVYPVTGLGKFLAAFLALVGMGMIALPAGIISSAFSTWSQQKNLNADADKECTCPHCGHQIEKTPANNDKDLVE